MSVQAVPSSLAAKPQGEQGTQAPAPDTGGAAPGPAGRSSKRATPTGMKVAELARATGVSVRNIRAYQTAGLLPPPALHGRLGLYSSQHRSRLELIRELRHLGFGLEAIGELLARMPDRAGAEYSLVAQMFSNGFFRVEQPLRMRLADLTVHWGEDIDPDQVRRMLEGGLYQAVDSPPGAPLSPDTCIEILSPSLWSIGKQMAEMKIPLGTVLDMQERLITHTRALAQAYVEQFAIAMVREMSKTLGDPGAAAEAQDKTAPVTPGQPPAGEQGEAMALPPQALRTVHNLFERLRPLAIGGISAAFPVVLQQEFDRGMQDKLQARLQHEANKRQR